MCLDKLCTIFELEKSLREGIDLMRAENPPMTVHGL